MSGIDLAPVGQSVLSNPLVVAMIVKVLTDVAKNLLKKTDESGQVVKYKGAVAPIVFVLTTITAVLSAGMEGSASSVDPSSLVSFVVTTALASIGVHGTVKEASKAVSNIKNSNGAK